MKITKMLSALALILFANTAYSKCPPIQSQVFENLIEQAAYDSYLSDVSRGSSRWIFQMLGFCPVEGGLELRLTYQSCDDVDGCWSDFETSERFKNKSNELRTLIGDFIFDTNVNISPVRSFVRFEDFVLEGLLQKRVLSTEQSEILFQAMKLAGVPKDRFYGGAEKLRATRVECQKAVDSRSVPSCSVRLVEQMLPLDDGESAVLHDSLVELGASVDSGKISRSAVNLPECKRLNTPGSAAECSIYLEVPR